MFTENSFKSPLNYFIIVLKIHIFASKQIGSKFLVLTHVYNINEKNKFIQNTYLEAKPPSKMYISFVVSYHSDFRHRGIELVAGGKDAV